MNYHKGSGEVQYPRILHKYAIDSGTITLCCKIHTLVKHDILKRCKRTPSLTCLQILKFGLNKFTCDILLSKKYRLSDLG